MNIKIRRQFQLFEYDMIRKEIHGSEIIDSLEASSLENGRFSSVVLDGIRSKYWQTCAVLELVLLFVVFELNRTI